MEYYRDILRVIDYIECTMERTWTRLRYFGSSIWIFRLASTYSNTEAPLEMKTAIDDLEWKKI